eukprot:186952-Amphidinium_carterae.1
MGASSSRHVPCALPFRIWLLLAHVNRAVTQRQIARKSQAVLQSEAAMDVTVADPHHHVKSRMET